MAVDSLDNTWVSKFLNEVLPELPVIAMASQFDTSLIFLETSEKKFKLSFTGIPREFLFLILFIMILLI